MKYKADEVIGPDVDFLPGDTKLTARRQRGRGLPASRRNQDAKPPCRKVQGDFTYGFEINSHDLYSDVPGCHQW
jgi:hypothetical protein